MTNTNNTADTTAATIHIGSDSYAATIVRRTAKTVTLRWDSPSFDGKEQTFRMNKAGRWVSKCYRAELGVREDYRDPSF